jgi:hypothetical protein
MPTLRRTLIIIIIIIINTDALREVKYEIDTPVPASSVTHISVDHCAGLKDVKGFIAKCPNLQ